MSVFQSQAWQQSWWSIWGSHPGFALVEPAAGENSGFYVDRYRFKGVLPVSCLQFIGTNYRRLSTPRTEYNCLNVSDEPDPASARLKGVESAAWTEAVFRDMRAATVEIPEIYAWANRNGWTIRKIHDDKAYSVRTVPSFDDYLAKLGSSTRLKLFNRRKILNSLGIIAFDNYWPSRAPRFFELLNAYHEKRWGVPCFSAASLEFHQSFLHAIGKEGGRPELSVMTLDGEPISVVYNMVYGGCTYNLQSGYVENFHKKVALGMLHLGYCLEQAFADEEVECFDLLAGHGKNSDYKRHIATDEEELISLMVVRSRIHRAIYQCKDKLSTLQALVRHRTGRRRIGEPVV